MSFINLFLVFLVALSGAYVWSFFDKERKEYRDLYYWLRVLVRYRLAYALLAWGFKKVFLMQMQVPTEGLLTTPLIDMFVKKLYWNHIGVVPWYTIFLGFAEVIPGLLLLFRKTTVWGAALGFVVLANIWIANHAYEVGEHVASFYLTLLAGFILWYDLKAVYQLLVQEKDILHKVYYPQLNKFWNGSRLGVKIVLNGIFVVFFTYSEWHGYYFDNYRKPNNPGLTGTQGHYHVEEFKLNNKTISYSPFDPVRWQDATFEEWSSISFKINETQDIDRFIAVWFGKPYPKREMEKSVAKRDISIAWELTGIGGGRHYYYYDADTVNKVLYLTNKNKGDHDQKQILSYRQPAPGVIELSGVNEHKDSIHVRLRKDTYQYPLLTDRSSIEYEY